MTSLIIAYTLGLISGYIGGWQYHKLYLDYKEIVKDIPDDYKWYEKLDMYFEIVGERALEKLNGKRRNNG